jgi:hypothetical protein
MIFALRVILMGVKTSLSNNGNTDMRIWRHQEICLLFVTALCFVYAGLPVVAHCVAH